MIFFTQNKLKNHYLNCSFLPKISVNSTVLKHMLHNGFFAVAQNVFKQKQFFSKYLFPFTLKMKCTAKCTSFGMIKKESTFLCNNKS